MELCQKPKEFRIVLIVDGTASPAEQMERDRQLSGLMGPDCPVLLRLFRISRGATVGRTWQGCIPGSWKIPSRDVSVRPTGGGAVLHGKDLCLSLFLPRHLLGLFDRNWPAFYQDFHSIINNFLLQLGQSSVVNRDCHVPNSEESVRENTHDSLCFRDPVPGDLMLDGAKILGGALAITRKGVLYQGSLQIPRMDPGVLSYLFEEWYCSKGRPMINRILLMKGRKFGSSGTLCANRSDGGSAPSNRTAGNGRP